MTADRQERPVVRVKFVDFWPGFDQSDNWLTSVLSHRFDLEFVDDPELLIFGPYGRLHRHYRCKKLLLSWENRPWGFSQCDFAITSNRRRSRRHYRLPLWVATLDETANVVPPPHAMNTRGFAAIVTSNGSSSIREHIHDLLEAIAPVASGGRHRNNVGGPVDDKLEFMSGYRFGVACENSSAPGYTTEKLLQALVAGTVPIYIDGLPEPLRMIGLQALVAGTVPIYWGDPTVAADFNPKRFIDFASFSTDDEFIARVRELNDRPDLLDEVLEEPWFVDGQLPACADLDAFRDWFDWVRTSRRRPVGSRWRYGPRLAAHRLTDRIRAFVARRSLFSARC